MLSNRYWQREFGGEPARRRADAAHSRTGVHDRRRARRLVQRHGPDARARDLGAGALRGGSRAGRHQRERALADGLVADRSPRAALAVRQGAADARHLGRTGARATMDVVVGAPSCRASADQQGSAGHGPANRRHAAPSRSGPHARVARHRHDARGGPRARHRVRERCRHAARARGGASARDRHPPCRRRRPGPARPPAADRKPHPRRPRRGRRRAARVVAHAAAHHVRSADPDRAVARSPAGRARPGFTAGVALLTGVLAGLAPALRATRANLVRDLKGDVTAAGSAAAAGRDAMCSSSGRWR